MYINYIWILTQALALKCGLLTDESVNTDKETKNKQRQQQMYFSFQSSKVRV